MGEGMLDEVIECRILEQLPPARQPAVGRRGRGRGRRGERRGSPGVFHIGCGRVELRTPVVRAHGAADQGHEAGRCAQRPRCLRGPQPELRPVDGGRVPRMSASSGIDANTTIISVWNTST